MQIMDEKKKPTPIKEHSSWPWHDLLLHLRDECEAAPDFIRKAVIMKTIERCLRLGAKLAVYYEFPPSMFLLMAAAQLKREGGEDVHVEAIPIPMNNPMPGANGDPENGSSDPSIN